jgi:roadblock/LC7 domain-containing protein
LEQKDFIESSEKGVANGVATLDTSSKVPTTQLPTDLAKLIDIRYGGFPNNKILYDQYGFPSVYVYIPKFNWDPINGFASTTVHPAFIWDGVEHGGFWVGKYQECARVISTGAIKATQTSDWSASVAGHVAASLPYQDPAVFLNYNAAIDLVEAKNSAAMRAAGNIFHVMTNAEWSAVAIWCKQMYKDAIFSSYCRGNNNYSRDVDNKGITGLPLNETLTIGSSGGTYGAPYYGRWRTGSGGAMTAHNFDPSGIFDMNGNVWEWIVGLQSPNANNGKDVYIIPNNEAAIATVAQLKNIAASPAAPWLKLGELASLNDEPFSKENITNFIGYSQTSGSLVIGIRYIITTYVAEDDFTNVGAASNATGVVFTATGTTPTVWTYGSTISLYDVERLAICAHSDVTTDYGSDFFYKPDEGKNNVPLRGGGWTSITNAGLFYLSLINVVTDANNSFGLRSAFVGDISAVTK